MNIEKIQCFVDIVKLNSFTKAAEKNFITQAAISQQIASMEAELGLKLFNRSKKGFSLTDSGQSFYESCEVLLSTYSRGLSRARCFANNSSGFVSMGLWPGLNSSFMFDAMKKLLTIYPSSQFIIRDGSPATHYHYFKESKLALVIAMPYDFYDRTISDLVVTPLFECGYNLCVSADHPLASKDSVSIQEVIHERFAVLSDDYLGSKTVGHVVSEQMQNENFIMDTFSTPNFATQQLMVASGQAVMLIPKVCTPDTNLPIKVIRLNDYKGSCKMSAIWKSNHASPALTKYIELLSTFAKDVSII